MRPIPIILASASPARLATLRRAGVYPQVLVSGVDERALTTVAEAKLGVPLSPAENALLLARAKAEAAAHRIFEPAETRNSPTTTPTPNTQRVETPKTPRTGIVIGCDSILEMAGRAFGRPKDATEAFARIQAMRNNTGILHTGHWVIDARAPESGGTGAALGATGSTKVFFGDIDDAEIAAYVATGEPLQVAGSFTVDGLGGPYITGIEGDYHNVVAISLPLLRDLLSQMGIPWRAIRG